MPNKETEYSSPFGVNNQIYFCGLPFRLDSYASSCSHRCAYCLKEDSLVLMADLSLKPIAEVLVGDQVVGFDEYPVNNQRHLRISKVLATSARKTENLWRTITPNGDLYSTGAHPWMHARGSWSKPQFYGKRGTSLRYFIPPIQVYETKEYKHGYIVGFFDAEGSMRYTPGQTKYYTPSSPYFTIGQAENNKEALERFANYILTFGIKTETQLERSNDPEKYKNQAFYTIMASDLDRVRTAYELINNVPSENPEFQRGWLAGFFDGEGTFSAPASSGIFISNNNEFLNDRLKEYGNNFCFQFNREAGGCYLLGGTSEATRFISFTSPAIGRKRTGWGERTRWGKSVETGSAERILGRSDVYDIETSSRTFFANGYASHNCYVRAAELTSHSRKSRGETIQRADDFRPDLASALAKADRDTKSQDINVEWLKRRVPIHWGGMSDPFQACERKFKISRRWIEILNWYNYPVVISTKGVMLAESEYLELLKKGNYAVQVSLLTDNDDWLKQLEPGAPLASERLKMLEILAASGIWTAVRIQPVIPNTIVEREMPRFIEKLARIGVKHVLCEGYKVPIRAEKNMKYIWRICPEAMREYQYSDNRTEGFELLLPTWRKWQYTKTAIQAAHENGITYGAADNDLRDMGDVICCCGIDNLPGFENFWRYQASQAAVIAKQKGFVTLEDMNQFWHGEKGFSVHNDQIRLSHKAEFGNIQATPKYAIDYFWERGGSNSPECICSMKRAARNGKVVYERKDPVVTLESRYMEQPSMF